MDEKDIEKIIYDYLRKHLKVHICKDGDDVEVEVELNGKVISSDTTYTPYF